ncbi:hypothetical protein [Nodosilinea sp. P-1105]|uniref:hypothetical protein n=1 Tax=Nodosilinea sp. P-1105 TaxID=2546229 RepID=UPI00146AE713|nr:hypothetical protein [Nodosilinea sp. P-1105]NMF82550.1 hypothetical protein [Nodosilinea sp. P-1105]
MLYRLSLVLTIAMASAISGFAFLPGHSNSVATPATQETIEAELISRTGTFVRSTQRSGGGRRGTRG